MAEFTAVILAAGQGTRMKSEFPKVLHRVCGVPMVEQVIRLVREAGSDHQVVITGFKEHLVREYLGNQEVSFVHQEEQLGTGHAVMQLCAGHLRGYAAAARGDDRASGKDLQGGGCGCFGADRDP